MTTQKHVDCPEDACCGPDAVRALHHLRPVQRHAGETVYYCSHCSALAQDYVLNPCETIAALDRGDHD